jgi:hypothetical protein
MNKGTNFPSILDRPWTAPTPEQIEEEHRRRHEGVINFTDRLMREAVEKIDGMFGQGHAKGNPELLVGFMRMAFDNLAEDDGIAAAIRGMPDTGGVADALDRVSSSLDSMSNNIAIAVDGLKLAK